MKKHEKTLVPRNPYAILARGLKAGEHRKSNKAQRQADRVALAKAPGQGIVRFGVAVTQWQSPGL